MGATSSPEQISQIISILSKYLRLPFSDQNIPGSIMEHVFAHVRKAEVLNTYDFIDVIDRKEKIGWQVKSTKYDTPVTWKRAKIANSLELIESSRKSEEGLKILGEAIVDFCNNHAIESMRKYDLEQIGYIRIIVFPDKVQYFERVLSDQKNPYVFDKSKYQWKWSKQKNSSKKEQLSALHGVDISTGKKIWSWHGLGENQLHFNGEKDWWPGFSSYPDAVFNLPDDSKKISIEEFLTILDSFK